MKNKQRDTGWVFAVTTYCPRLSFFFFPLLFSPLTASKAKPIYIANASRFFLFLFFFFPLPPFLELETGENGRVKKGDFSFAGNLETLSS